MGPVHGIRGLESESIGLYELAPGDDLFAKAGCEVVKTFGQSGYNADSPS
jgi:hypothetical protein